MIFSKKQTKKNTINKDYLYANGEVYIYKTYTLKPMKFTFSD